MSIQFRHFLRYQFPAIGWALFIFSASSIPARYLPSHTILKFDKAIHVTLFFVFGILVYRALETNSKRNSFSWGRLFLSIFIVVLYGVLDETYQGTVPGRTLDIWDAIANSVGGILAGGIIYLYFRRRYPAP